MSPPKCKFVWFIYLGRISDDPVSVEYPQWLIFPTLSQPEQVTKNHLSNIKFASQLIRNKWDGFTAFWTNRFLYSLLPGHFLRVTGLCPERVNAKSWGRVQETHDFHGSWALLPWWVISSTKNKNYILCLCWYKDTGWVHLNLFVAIMFNFFCI